jgi:hypothetical protein
VPPSPRESIKLGTDLSRSNDQDCQMRHGSTPCALAAKVARIMDGSRRRVWLTFLAIAAGTIAPGCERPFLLPALSQRLKPVEGHFREPSWSGSTSALLESLGLTDLARRHPCDAFCLLEQGTDNDPADSQRLLALAELADLIARGSPQQSSEAIRWSRDAAVYAVFCLTELEENQPGPSMECAACAVHNGALARCLQAAQTDAAFCQTTSGWAGRLGEAGVFLTATNPEWTALGFDTLRPLKEFAAVSPGPSGSRTGLGIPLIARRTLNNAEQATWKPYGPRDAVFAATAVIQPRGTVTTWREQPAELVLHDPFRDEHLNLGRRSFPLACELTSPLIERLTQSPIRNYECLGVLDAKVYSARAGVYAVDPYQAGKIPVVLVQGLGSSPAVWIPMLAALRSDPVLRASYQFWVVLYPSGDPLPMAALSLRRSLREIRQTFDPMGTDSALDQMVILGKSTGGQALRLLVQPSGEALWNAVFTRPINEISATPELLTELAAIFFFQPEPAVHRVIFLTTAHRGGELAGHPLVRLGIKLIHTNPLQPAWTLLETANGRELFQPFFQHQAPISVDGMEAGNPLLTAIDTQTIAPDVACHSIIANTRPGSIPEKMSDGLVSYVSAHLDGAASEQIVSANHNCEANLVVIAEVRRILHLNLTER